jgi:hypothetical protein
MACGAVDADIVHKHGQEWEMIMMEYQAESDWLTQFADQGLRPWAKSPMRAEVSGHEN